MLGPDSCLGGSEIVWAGKPRLARPPHGIACGRRFATPVKGEHVRAVTVSPPEASYAWLLDLLYSRSPSACWAPAGQLPAGYRLAGRLAVLPAGGQRAFLLSLASRPGSSSALTCYNGLRSPRRRAERLVLGFGLRAGIVQPLLRSRVDIGLADGIAPGEQAGALITEHLAGLFDAGEVVIAAGGGSGPYRKPVLQAFSVHGTPLGYVKIGWNDWTRAAVSAEAAALGACTGADAAPGLGTAGPGVPALLHQGTWNGLDLVVTAPLPGRVRRHPDSLPGTGLLRAIADLDPGGWHKLAASSWWALLRARIAGQVSDQAAAARLDGIASAIERSAGQAKLEFGRWHGDLVPWNLATLGTRTFAWDWESSTASAPVGFDALHFCFQVGFVARQMPLAAAAARAARDAGPALAALGVPAEAADLLPALHLLELAVRHEEARSATGDADDRFFPEVLDLLEQQLAAAPCVPPSPVGDTVEHAV